jgi:hypothetical protein
MTKNEQPVDLIDLYEAARLLERHPNTLRNWTRRAENPLKKYRDFSKPNNKTYVSKAQLFQLAGRIEKEFVETQHVAHGSMDHYTPPTQEPKNTIPTEYLEMMLSTKDQTIAILKEQAENQREDILELKKRVLELREDNREMQKQLLNQPRALLNPYIEPIDDVPMPTFPTWDD